jgi:membrane-associated HD superfamily phosphohydrolase
MFKLTTYNKRALYGGVIAAIVTGAGAYLVGNLSGYEAKVLIKSSLPGINTLCNTIVLASATILALLLTLLSVSSSTKSKLTAEHYKHVLLIAKIDTVVFVVAMIVFQLLNIPITEAENVPSTWFSSIYYISLGLSALLSGGLISVVLMLFNAVSSIIKIVGLGIEDHPLIYKKDEEKPEDNK